MTGIFCASCHGSTVKTSQPYIDGAAGIGVVVVAALFFFHITINGLNYVAAGAAAVGFFLGVLAIVAALRSDPLVRNRRIGVGAVVVAFAGLHFFRSGLL